MSCLIVVDVQRDFCEKGSLEVPHSLEIIDGINMEIISGKYKSIVFTADWHPHNHVSFGVNHPGKELFSTIVVEETGREQTLWPVHCVQDTDGAKFHPLLKVPEGAKVFKKGTETLVECYSGFGELGLSDTGLDQYLKDNNIHQCFVVGLAYDYCVAHTAMDSLKKGYTTTIYEDLTRGISKEKVEKFKVEFVKAGGLISKAHK